MSSDVPQSGWPFEVDDSDLGWPYACDDGPDQLGDMTCGCTGCGSGGGWFPEEPSPPRPKATRDVLRARFDGLWSQLRPNDPLGGTFYRTVWRAVSATMKKGGESKPAYEPEGLPEPVVTEDTYDWAMCPYSHDLGFSHTILPTEPDDGVDVGCSTDPSGGDPPKPTNPPVEDQPPQTGAPPESGPAPPPQGGSGEEEEPFDQGELFPCGGDFGGTWLDGLFGTPPWDLDALSSDPLDDESMNPDDQSVPEDQDAPDHGPDEDLTDTESPEQDVTPPEPGSYDDTGTMPDEQQGPLDGRDPIHEFIPGVMLGVVPVKVGIIDPSELMVIAALLPAADGPEPGPADAAGVSLALTAWLMLKLVEALAPPVQLSAPDDPVYPFIDPFQELCDSCLTASEGSWLQWLRFCDSLPVPPMQEEYGHCRSRALERSKQERVNHCYAFYCPG